MAHFKKWPKWRGYTRGKYFVSLIILYGLCNLPANYCNSPTSYCNLLANFAICPLIAHLPAGMAAFSGSNRTRPCGQKSGVFTNKMLFLDVY
jgi:hypothetical protein